MPSAAEDPEKPGDAPPAPPAAVPDDPATSMRLPELWARLALVWLIQFTLGWGVVIAMSVFIVFPLFPLFLVVSLAAGERGGLAAQLLILAFFLPLVALVAYLCLPILMRTILTPPVPRAGLPAFGLSLTRAEQPRLWAAVDEVARRLAYPAPRRIWLDLDPTLNPRLVPYPRQHPWQRDWDLACGLPFLAAFDADGFAARVAIAIQSGRRRARLVDRLAAGRYARVLRAMEPNADALSYRWMESLSERLGALLAPVVRNAAYRTMRRAAAVTRPEAVAEVIGRQGLVTHLGTQFMRVDAYPVMRNGLRPPLAEGFQRFLNAPHIRRQEASLQRQLAESWDASSAGWCMPAQARRFLGLGPTAPGAADSGSMAPSAAAALLEDLDALELRLIEAASPLLDASIPQLDPAALEPCAWDALGGAYVPRFRDFVLEHREALVEITFDQVPAFAHNPRAFAARLPQRERAVDAELSALDETARILGAAITVVLADRGWHVDLSPDVAVLTLTHGDRSVAPHDAIVRMYRDPKAADQWRAAIAAAGLTELDIGAALGAVEALPA